MMKDPTSLSTLVSGSADGEIRLWNMASRKCLLHFKAHDGMTRAICSPSSGSYFFSLDSNCNIKQWKLDGLIGKSVGGGDDDNDDDDFDADAPREPINTLIGESLTISMDHHRKKPLMLIVGEKVELWEETRSEPLKSYSWSNDSTNYVAFNPVEVDVAATCSFDRSITLYDVRKTTPLRKVVMEMRSNSISWNPMEAFTFTVANEDYS